jgi:ABC-type polysaccharide/polyol phosphate transport system ATPase subunit
VSSVIKVDNISKRYRIGGPEKKYDTFAAQLMGMVKAPFQNFKELRSLKHFNEEDDATTFWALRNVSFELKEGEVLGVIGHNGAGKSTLLKILSRITEPSDGEITIQGRVSSLLEVGTGFHPDLSGRDNIYMNGTILGMTKKEIDGKLDEIVEFSGISKHIDTPVKRYSSGMTVRLAFSVAAHLEPEILIIDEVLAVGDAEFQKKCLGKMKDVSGQGRTVLFVSHNMPAVQTLCTKALWLQKGQVKEIGNTHTVATNYLRGFKDGLIGNSYKSSERKSGCYFDEITLTSTGGENFLMGDDIIFDFKVQADLSLPNFQIGVKMFDQDNHLVTSFYNTDFGIQFDLKEGTNQFSFRTKGCNLLPGSYHLSFTAQYNYGQQLFEKVEDLVSIEFLTHDVSGSGIPLLKDRGMIWLPLER